MPKGGTKSKVIAEETTTPAPKSRRELVRDLLTQFETKFKAEDVKVTLSDYIRLTELARELEEEEQPREIIITWSEPPEKQSVER